MEYQSEPVDDGLEAALKNIHNVYLETLRSAFKIDDKWKYVSTNLSKTDYKKIIKLVGNDNIKFVSSTNTVKNVRFSMFISPEGLNNIVTHMKEQA